MTDTESTVIGKIEIFSEMDPFVPSTLVYHFHVLDLQLGMRKPSEVHCRSE
jgi:hypothetical protein